MEHLKLNPSEVQLYKLDYVSQNGGRLLNNTGELVLTNTDIIFVTKGSFGGIKDITRYPLSQIKMYNGEPQVMVGRDSKSLQITIDIYLLNGQESFTLYNSVSKKEAVKFRNAVYKHLTGYEPEDEPNSNIVGAIPGAAFVADTLKGTVDVFKNSFGIKSKGASNENEQVTKKCLSCSAPLSGRRGQRVKCKYCDTEQVL